MILFSSSVRAEQSIDKLMIGQFSSETLDQWESKSFKGQTHYELTKLEGTTVLKVESNGSGSGLFKEQRIDLQKTPIMIWSWRIENRLGNINEQDKSGDDYAARVYIVVSTGLAFWRTRAINYVWASTSPKGKIWLNAFAGDHVMMIALRSSANQTGT